MDADGIPLFIHTHWQKAMLGDQVCGKGPRITTIGLKLTIFG